MLNEVKVKRKYISNNNGLKRTIVEIEDAKIDCFGNVMDDSNFEIVCENEDYDGIYANGNPNRDDFTFRNWSEVVEHLYNYYSQ